MIKDIIENLDIDFKKAIFDNYQLKDGLYLRIGERVEYFIYKKSKKDSSKEVGLKDLKGNIRANEYEWFVRRDYFSNLLTIDKPIASKKIHSNNYLAFFVKSNEWKKENIKFFKEYFEILKDFKKFNKKTDKTLLTKFQDYINDIDRIKNIEIKKKEIFSLFEKIEVLVESMNLTKTQKEKFYIKIFFNEKENKYIKESKIYLTLKIYNKNKYVYEHNNNLIGMSGYNLTVADKKIFLQHQTRGFKLPYLVSQDEIFKIKEFFDFLKYQSKPINESPTRHKTGIFVVKHSNNDQAEIIDFDILVKEDELNKKFIYKDYLSFKPEDRKIGSFKELFNLVNEVFYNGNLKNNLFKDVYSKLPNNLQNLIYLTRDGMIALKKGEITPLLKINKKFADEFIIYHLKQNREYKAKKALNLKLSLLAYEGEEMNIKETLKEIEGKIDNLEELNKNEFFILSGQIIKYLLDKSKKSDKKADMIEPFLRAGKVKKLKSEIETLFFTYKHEIPLNFKKFNNALALVESFEENGKVEKDKLLVGLLSDNIFYRKDEK